MQGVGYVLLLGHAQGGDAVGVGEFDVVRAGHRHLFDVAVKEHFLPLAHHAQVAVVEQGDFDGQLFLDGGNQFLEGHLEAAVAGDGPDGGAGAAQLGAQGGGNLKAHYAEAAGGYEGVGAVEEQVLRRPHLVLAHAGDDDGVVVLPDEVVELRQHLLGHQGGAGGDGQGGMFGGHTGDGCHPFGALAPLGQGGQGLEDRAGVADQGDFGGDDAPHLAGFDVQVDDAGVGGEAGDASGYAVVEAHSQADDNVGLVNDHIAPVHTVHSQHTEALGVIAGEGA